MRCCTFPRESVRMRMNDEVKSINFINNLITCIVRCSVNACNNTNTNIVVPNIEYRVSLAHINYFGLYRYMASAACAQQILCVCIFCDKYLSILIWIGLDSSVNSIELIPDILYILVKETFCVSPYFSHHSSRPILSDLYFWCACMIIFWSSLIYQRIKCSIVRSIKWYDEKIADVSSKNNASHSSITIIHCSLQFSYPIHQPLDKNRFELRLSKYQNLRGKNGRI